MAGSAAAAVTIEFGCINRVCGPPAEALYATHWRMYESGTFTDYSVDDFTANPGDELVLSYVTRLTCLTPVGCDGTV